MVIEWLVKKILILLNLKSKQTNYPFIFFVWVIFCKFVFMHPTRIFRSPDELELAFKAYKKSLIVEAQEWLKVQYVGKEGQRMTDELKLPYTMDGFEVFCYENYGTVEQYFKNKDGYYDEFVPICSHIKKVIRSNQITGGMLGVFNTSITQRLNNLVEKVEDVTPQSPKKLIVKIQKRETD